MDFSISQNINNNFSFKGRDNVKITPEKIAETISVQKPNREFSEPFNDSKYMYQRILIEKQIKPEKKEKVLFEDTQNGYIPSTKGYIEEKDETSYVPSTKPAPYTPEDLTAAKIAIQNSFMAENLTNTRIKDKFKRRI